MIPSLVSVALEGERNVCPEMYDIMIWIFWKSAGSAGVETGEARRARRVRGERARNGAKKTQSSAAPVAKIKERNCRKKVEGRKDIQNMPA